MNFTAAMRTSNSRGLLASLLKLHLSLVPESTPKRVFVSNFHVKVYESQFERKTKNVAVVVIVVTVVAITGAMS